MFVDMLGMLQFSEGKTALLQQTTVFFHTASAQSKPPLLKISALQVLEQLSFQTKVPCRQVDPQSDQIADVVVARGHSDGAVVLTDDP